MEIKFYIKSIALVILMLSCTHCTNSSGLSAQGAGSGGSGMYIHWGANTCAAGYTLIYSGWAYMANASINSGTYASLAAGGIICSSTNTQSVYNAAANTYLHQLNPDYLCAVCSK